MRHILSGHKHLSLTALLLTSIALGSCSAPDRLRNDDIQVEATKQIVRDRLISPIENERVTEFNQRIPRRSILQVIHAPESLSDPTFLQLIETQLSEEINFKIQQRQEAGIQEVAAPQPRELSEDEKARITKTRGDARDKLMFDKGLELETFLFGKLREMETRVDELFLKTVPLNSNAGEFPDLIGANLTEDPNGYLSLPADLYLIGGRDSAFISKTAILADHVTDLEFNLSVRQIPLQDVLALVSQSIGVEFTLSQGVESLDRTVSLSVRAGALSILDSLLTQNGLAILYDSNRDIARFYTDEELVLLDTAMKAAIRGHNELLFNKKNLARAESDLTKISAMIDTSQLLLSGDDKGFNAGIKGFPRSSMGEIATDSLSFLSNENFILRQQLERFDEETASLLDPSKETMTNELRAQTGGMSLSDILVEDACIRTGQEIFVEKIAVYNADKDEAQEHLENYFTANGTASAPVVDEDEDAADEDAAAEGDAAEGDAAEGGAADALADAVAGAADAATNAAAAAATGTDANGCDTDYEVTFQRDSTGLIVRGRRYDNSLAVRLIEEFDVPRLQVLVEIFMITVSRDFNRQIANLITEAVNAAGGNGITEAALRSTTITTPGGSIGADTLTNISQAIAGGYSVNLRSPGGNNGDPFISSALSFLESNQLGRVLSSPTILVEDGAERASISRTQVAKLIYTETTNDNGTVTTNQVEAEEEAPFELVLEGVEVYPANRTVRMGVTIKNKRFTESNINDITTAAQADYTEDTIETAFTAAPGDVIVLAGLAANSENTTTRGLPGTTGAIAPLAPLVGGSDQVSSNVSEMIIFMAPTVIDPSSDFQPHSAFRPPVPLSDNSSDQ